MDELVTARMNKLTPISNIKCYKYHLKIKFLVVKFGSRKLVGRFFVLPHPTRSKNGIIKYFCYNKAIFYLFIIIFAFIFCDINIFFFLCKLVIMSSFAYLNFMSLICFSNTVVNEFHRKIILDK